MTFDEALARLMDLLGKEVIVTVKMPGNAGVSALMNMSGRLLAPGDPSLLRAKFERMGYSEEDVDLSVQVWAKSGFSDLGEGVVYFALNETLFDGFFVDRERFRDAREEMDGEIPVLIIEMANDVVLWIENWGDVELGGDDDEDG